MSSKRNIRLQILSDLHLEFGDYEPEALAQTVPLTYRSTSELVSVLIGTPAATALLGRYGTLTEVARQTEEEIARLANITFRRAKRVKTALLLAQKLAQECHPERPLIDNPDKVADLLREENRTYAVETFQIVMLKTLWRYCALG